MIAVRLGGKGDVTNTHLAWQVTQGLALCPVSCGARAVRVQRERLRRRLLHVAKTGKEAVERALGGDTSASPVLIDGKIYAVDMAGNVYVFEAGPKFKLLAKNAVGEPVMGARRSPNGRLYIRGRSTCSASASPRPSKRRTSAGCQGRRAMSTAISPEPTTVLDTRRGGPCAWATFPWTASSCGPTPARHGPGRDRLQEDRRLCELVDGVLVEKAMGYYEDRLGSVLIFFLELFIGDNGPGFCLAHAGMIRTDEVQVRMPDVAYFAWAHFANRTLPSGQILDLRPDLAVEILSPKNTRAEMDRKRREYFDGGTKLVWQVYPRTHVVRVYTAVDEFTELGENDTLDGGPVLPGFTLPVRRWFEHGAAGRRIILL